jgi:hypothetical protein
LADPGRAASALAVTRRRHDRRPPSRRPELEAPGEPETDLQLTHAAGPREPQHGVEGQAPVDAPDGSDQPGERGRFLSRVTVADVGERGALTRSWSAPAAEGARVVVVDARGAAYVADSRGGRILVFR